LFEKNSRRAAVGRRANAAWTGEALKNKGFSMAGRAAGRPAPAFRLIFAERIKYLIFLILFC
jgi:hypothetical protein